MARKRKLKKITKSVSPKVEPVQKKKSLLKQIALGLVIGLVLVLIFGRSPVEDVDNEVDIMTEIVVLETSKGNIEIELNREKAPVTVENFLTYVKEGHFDGTIFHRVISKFMIQGGGFTPDTNQKPTRDPIKLESQNGLKNARGTLAMARTGVPDSATAQFFINLAENEFLDYAPGNDGYAVFGKVLAGMDVVENIEAVATSSKGPHQDWPVEDILITKAYLKG